MTDNDPRCAQCGGPVGKDGQTLQGRRMASIAPSPPRAAMSPSKDDPLEDQVLAERYARAVERRDALIRDRRMSKGRRQTDKHA
jgi:hypothetical protein